MYKRIESQKCALNGTTSCDWHRADIIAELRKKGERIIASAIGVEPSEIWPSRYGEVA